MPPAEIWIAGAVGVAASAEDLWRRQISNWTVAAALVGGSGLQVLERGWTGLAAALLGAACGFGVFLVFYLLGGMGGGDVKLMAGFGSLLGASRVLESALWVAGIGGVMALLVLGWRAAARQRLRKTPGKAGEPAAGADSSGESMPYAPAITLGVWIVLWGSAG